MVKKQKDTKKPLAEFIFWVHTLVIVLILASGLFMPFWWVVFLLVLLRLQQIVFHGCILTVLEIKDGGIKRGAVYFQLAAHRFFGLRLSRNGVHVVFWIHVLLTLGISLWATHHNLRLHV